jgi:hypothetical protein
MSRALYQVGHLARLPLGTTYPAVVAHVGRLLGQFPGAELAIDFTGVGRPVFDMFVYGGISPTGVLITAGTAETREGAICHVPKLTLVSRLQALLHEGRLKILRALPEAEVLIRELSDFRVQFTTAGNMAFNARSGRHDDLVLALAIAVWRAEGGGMVSWGLFEATRMRVTGVGTTLFIGCDIGQARDPTAICIVRKVDNPAPEDFVSMPVAEPPTRTYAVGSVEASRTASTAPVTADWEQRRIEIASRPTQHHPDVRGLPPEPINGPGVKPSYAIGSVEWAAAQARKAAK